MSPLRCLCASLVIVASSLALSHPATAQAPFNADPPNANGQGPAFPEQTRAPLLADAPALSAVPFAQGLEHPWGMAELPDGRWLVTERPGRLRLVEVDGRLSPPISGLPPVFAVGQGGLLDVIIGPDFQDTRRVWWSYAEPRSDGNGTAVATGVLASDGASLNDVRVIFRQQPSWTTNYHFGSRLVRDQSGAIFITTGDRGTFRSAVQDPTTHIGKVVRIAPDGGPATGNPMISGAQPELWSLGHRNLQGAALDRQGRLWTVEHGPRGGDELNQPQAGHNYGWPMISYGVEYSGTAIGSGLTAKAGLDQPIYYWDPVIAPSGMTFYHGPLFPEWEGQILIGGLASQALVRLQIKDDKVIGEARHLVGMGRIRDVAVAHDGAIMVLIDAPDGAMVRVTPQNP